MKIKFKKLHPAAVMPIPEVELIEADELSETARGTGGYGSTGK